MNLGNAFEAVKQSLERAEMIVLFCSCSVSYSGRAESELEEGDRVILIKQDRSVMVHQPTGSTPVNYMKSESSVTPSLTENMLVLETRNLQDKDYLSISISTVYSLQYKRMHDGQDIQLVGTEKDMSDMIRREPEHIGEWFTAVSREEHTQFGFIDVFGHDGDGNLVIVECKRYTAGVSAVQQLRRYVEKIASSKGITPSSIRGVIAAPSIAKNAKEMIQSWGYEYSIVHPPKRHAKFNTAQQSLQDF